MRRLPEQAELANAPRELHGKFYLKVNNASSAHNTKTAPDMNCSNYPDLQLTGNIDGFIDEKVLPGNLTAMPPIQFST